jgi:hypothetical protein
MMKDIIFGISNQNNMTQTKYFIGDTLTLTSGYVVVVRKAITKRLLRVSYGFDSKGNDILSVIDVTIHLTA